MQKIQFKQLTFVLFLGLSILLGCSSNPKPQLQSTTASTNKPAKKVEDHIYIDYIAPTHIITITDNVFSHIQKQEHHAPNSVSPVPDSVSTHTLVDKFQLTDFQINNLKMALHSGFLKLPNEVGAPVEKRHYPYEMKIDLNGLKKEVIYRSNPAFDEMPLEFQTVQTFLFQLSQNIRK